MYIEFKTIDTNKKNMFHPKLKIDTLPAPFQVQPVDKHTRPGSLSFTMNLALISFSLKGSEVMFVQKYVGSVRNKR